MSLSLLLLLKWWLGKVQILNKHTISFIKLSLKIFFQMKNWSGNSFFALAWKCQWKTFFLFFMKCFLKWFFYGKIKLPLLFLIDAREETKITVHEFNFYISPL
jgi:hypothetical protein